MGRALVWVAGLATASCVVNVNGDNQDAGVGSTGNQNATCQAESFSAAKRKAIYQTAADNLTAQGQPLDRKVWNDPTRFGAYISEVYKVAGCSPPSGVKQQPLSGSTGKIYYCGPGHGTAKLQHPAVSDCLNKLCEMHDACYAMCSAKTSLTCMWDDNTSPCDAPFLSKADSCPDQPGTTLMSGAIVFLANLFDTAGSLFSCGNMTCPALGELGAGVCSQNPSGQDCTNCLTYTDRGKMCLDEACGGSLSDPICYAANCPEVAECYGGYGKGVPGGFTPPTPVSNPDAYTWTLHVQRGEIPATKPDGSEWDVDIFGWTPPDPYAVVTVGSATGSTGVVQDTYTPLWDSDVLTGLSAADLRAGIDFKVWDADLVDDDLVGTCHYEMGNDTFNAPALLAGCDVDGLIVSFYTTPDTP